jgi:prolyl oligopeptidase
MPLDARPTLAAPDDDPYLWLEEIDGAAALAWVEAQTAQTLRLFGGEKFERDRDALAALLDRPDKIPFIIRRGEAVYNFWQDAGHPRGLWRRTSLASYRESAPKWETLLDLDALAAEEGEDWVWAGAGTRPGAHDRAILRLSRGGGDAVTMREFDLGAKSFVAGGFALPEAKSGAEWLDEDSLLLSSAYGAGHATRSGYARTVRLWRRGEDPLAAKVIFETSFDAMAVSGGVDRTAAKPRRLVVERRGFFEGDLHFDDGAGGWTLLPLPAEAWKDVSGDWLVVKPRKAWMVGEATYPADTLVGMRLSRFMAGARDFAILFSPEARRSLQGFFWCGPRLVLSILDNLAPRFEVLTPSDEGWSRRSIGRLPEIGVVDLSPLDEREEERNGELVASVQDPLTPPSLFLLDLDEGDLASPALLKTSPPAFDAAHLSVSRHEAVSIDGERIPYVQVGPRELTGDALTHLTGYGGFGISEQPYYRTAIGKLWLERGGVSVVANLRGGGEFGTRWHDAGRRENKRLSHDDFAAVAADLVARGVTIPGRIGAEGGSNGGILIANMLTRYPERFGALFCTIPLIDMRRYTQLLAGASWIDEYGDPAKPEDWAYLQHISAYHAAEPGRAYPPILIATTRRDDRVHPGHARKMAAKRQALGYEAHFYEPAAGGHGYGKDNKERAAFIALGLGFLWNKLEGGKEAPRDRAGPTAA